MADRKSMGHAPWKFNALYADTEVRSAADDKLLAVVRAGPEKARILGLLKAAETPGTALLRGEGEQFTRFCPGCGSVGDVESKFRDCCPDGSGARLIPESLARKCHDLFQLALVGASQPELAESQPNAALADGWISVEDRLPDGGVEVLCSGVGWGEAFVMACYYDEERREWYSINTHWTDATGNAQYPTHWRPLPPPPTLTASKEGSHGK